MTAKKAFALVVVSYIPYFFGMRYLVHLVTIGQVSDLVLWIHTGLGGLGMLVVLSIFIGALIKTPPATRPL